MIQKLDDLFGFRSMESLRNVHPYLAAVLVATLKKSDIDFTITGGGRTTAEQQALYAKGRTAPGGKVTNADGVKNKSNHQAKADGWYYAVDLYPFIDGKVDVQDKANNLKKIADVFKEEARKLNIKVGWGGDWKSIVDRPHFELIP